jgi:hypothetical protein
MSRVSFEVPSEARAELEKKAESLGMSLAGYARKLVLDGSRRDPRGQQAELLRAMRAAVGSLGDAIGRVQKLPPNFLPEWVTGILNRYEKARQYNVGGSAGDSVAAKRGNP